jgi:hypothetical protein
MIRAMNIEERKGMDEKDNRVEQANDNGQDEHADKTSYDDDRIMAPEEGDEDEKETGSAQQLAREDQLHLRALLNAV